MDTVAVEQSIQEATASVRENVSSLERALLDIEEHTRYASLHMFGLELTIRYYPLNLHVLVAALWTLVTKSDKDVLND